MNKLIIPVCKIGDVVILRELDGVDGEFCQAVVTNAWQTTDNKACWIYTAKYAEVDGLKFTASFVDSEMILNLSRLIV